MQFTSAREFHFIRSSRPPNSRLATIRANSTKTARYGSLHLAGHRALDWVSRGGSAIGIAGLFITFASRVQIVDNVGKGAQPLARDRPAFNVRLRTSVGRA